jgi:hypothetical protein
MAARGDLSAFAKRTRELDLELGERTRYAMPSMLERYGWLFHVAIVAIAVYCIAKV